MPLAWWGWLGALLPLWVPSNPHQSFCPRCLWPWLQGEPWVSAQHPNLVITCEAENAHFPLYKRTIQVTELSHFVKPLLNNLHCIMARRTKNVWRIAAFIIHLKRNKLIKLLTCILLKFPSLFWNYKTTMKELHVNTARSAPGLWAVWILC